MSYNWLRQLREDYQMNIIDPIVIPSQLWTKDSIHEQLENDDIKPEDISDEDALWWVKQEDAIRFNAISNGEDYYGRRVAGINYTLVLNSKK